MKAESEREALARAARLVANPDFRKWVEEILEDFCTLNHGLVEVDAFRQGIRAAGSYIVSRLSPAEGFADLMAEIARRKFSVKNHTGEVNDDSRLS